MNQDSTINNGEDTYVYQEPIVTKIVKNEEDTFLLQWTITNFSLISLDTKLIESEVGMDYSRDRHSWQIKFYPHEMSNGERHICFNLYLVELGAIQAHGKLFVSLDQCFLNSNSKPVYGTWYNDHEVIKGLPVPWTLVPVWNLKHAPTFKNVLVDDRLTVHFLITILSRVDEKRLQIERLEQFRDSIVKDLILTAANAKFEAHRDCI